MARRRRLFRLPWRTAGQIRADVDEELHFHLDTRVDALVAEGVAREVAQTRALREFGDLDDARDYIGHMDLGTEAARRRGEMMRELWSDLVYGARKLRAAPVFTLTVIGTLALGIGANTAIFSVVDSLLLEQLPFAQSDHLVRVTYTQQGHQDVSTPPDLIDLRSNATKFIGFSVIEAATANIDRGTLDPERVTGARVNANWFTLLRTRPLAGRFFNESEDRVGAPNVVVLSEELWRRDFDASPGIVGRAVRINSEIYTVVGIAPAREHYPLTVELWMPRQFTAADLSDQTRGARWLSMLGRVKDGVSVADADAEVQRISAAMEHRFPEVFRDRRARAVELHAFIFGELRRPLLVILCAVGLVLLIACANVANLMIVRTSARQSEMAIRTALGAGRGRLVRQLVTESAVVTATGAFVGLVIARLAIHALIRLAPEELLLMQFATLDARALALTGIIAVVTAVAFGVLPATQVRRGELASALRAGARGVRGAASTSRLKRVVVVTEVALAVSLLTSAGLLVRSFQQLTSVDPGFRPDNVLTMKLQLPTRSYGAADKQILFARQLLAGVQSTPGVEVAALSDFVPFDGSSFDFALQVRGRPLLRPSDAPSAELREVTPNVFMALGIPLVRGRGVTSDDRAGSPGIVVVNREFVRQNIQHDDPIGQAVRIDWGSDAGSYREIVGVVGDVKGTTLGQKSDATVYVPLLQTGSRSLTIVVRSALPASAIAPPIRRVIHDLDADLPVYSVLSMRDRVGTSVGRPRFYATLMTVFAAVALLLSAVGLYGVIAYGVSQRTHELGVRIALGAPSSRVLRMILGEGLGMTAAGLALGFAASIAASRLLMTLLFGVAATDAITLTSVAFVFVLVAAAASYAPARRAARVDPLVALRGE